MRVDDDIQTLIHQHYDAFPHAVSGVAGFAKSGLTKYGGPKHDIFCGGLHGFVTWPHVRVCRYLCWVTPSTPMPFLGSPTVFPSGLPLDLLQADWWVPQSTVRSEMTKYKNNEVFKEILTLTQETCKTWILRATKDCNQNLGDLFNHFKNFKKHAYPVYGHIEFLNMVINIDQYGNPTSQSMSTKGPPNDMHAGLWETGFSPGQSQIQGPYMGSSESKLGIPSQTQIHTKPWKGMIGFKTFCILLLLSNFILGGVPHIKDVFKPCNCFGIQLLWDWFAGEM